MTATKKLRSKTLEPRFQDLSPGFWLKSRERGPGNEIAILYSALLNRRLTSAVSSINRLNAYKQLQAKNKNNRNKNLLPITVKWVVYCFNSQICLGLRAFRCLLTLISLVKCPLAFKIRFKKELDQAHSIVSFLKPRNLRRPSWWEHFAVRTQFVKVSIKHWWLG